MDEIESYLQASLQKDAKLCKFIENTLSNGPASENDEDEINKQNLSFTLPMRFDQDSVENYRGSSTNHAHSEMNQSMAFDLNVSSLVPDVSGNEPELSFYFAESNDFERDCVSTHVKRLKRELKESAKRKRERREQPEQRQFTGKPITGSVNIKGMKPKGLRSRQRKKTSAGAEKFDKA